VLALTAGSLAACGANDSSSGGKKIALLLPETKTTRYESFDKPLFEAEVAKKCGDCDVVYFNAQGDQNKQQQQVTTAINQGVDVIVLDPVNGDSAASMVSDAKAANIPTVAYDRFIDGADYYLSFDNEKVGELQGQALVDATNNTGNILMLNGAPDDPNAAQFKLGAHKVLDASGLKIVGEYDNPDWSPDNAQQYVTTQLSKMDPSSLAGVYAANDGQAGGVIAALTGAGVSTSDLPPITGQDAQLANIQDILAGEQYMTVYKPIPVEANQAADLAVNLANGDDITGTTTFQDTPSYIFTPVVVTKDNVKSTVVADKFYSVSDICTSEYKAACDAAGISS